MNYRYIIKMRLQSEQQQHFYFQHIKLEVCDIQTRN